MIVLTSESRVRDGTKGMESIAHGFETPALQNEQGSRILKWMPGPHMGGPLSMFCLIWCPANLIGIPVCGH